MGTIILGLVAITACILPFIGMLLSRKGTEKQLISGLKAMADSCNSQLATWDCGVEFAIGITSSKSFLFFYKYRNATVAQKSISLNDIQKCQVNNVRRTLKGRESSEVIIDKLELVLIPYDHQKPPTILEFFNSDEHFRPNGELPMIRKWETVINNALHEKTVFPIAS